MASQHGQETALEQTHITDRIVSFVASTTAADLPPSTLESAKSLVLDTIGVSLAASRRRVGRIVSQYVAAIAGAPATATILGAATKASPAMAALANGTLSNDLDFDGGGHLPTIILPVALALAEDSELSGEALLTAFIVAYEAAARLTSVIEAKRVSGDGAGPSPTSRGWWHVGLIGPVAGAITAAKLLGLSKAQMATAIGIATCSSGGFRRNMGTMAKALHSGNAARAGIEAALLAEAGFTADPAILESPLGFFGAVAPAEERDLTPIADLGKPYALEKYPGVKPYPSVTPSHALIDTVLAIRNRERFALDEVETIKTHLAARSLFRPQAIDEESAGFCGPFLIALALLHRAVSLDLYNDETFHDPVITGLMSRVVDVPAAELQGHKLVIRLRDGRELTAKADGARVKGPDFLLGKFRRCAEPVIGDAAVEFVTEQVFALDQLANIKSLMTACSGRA